MIALVFLARTKQLCKSKAVHEKLLQANDLQELFFFLDMLHQKAGWFNRIIWR